MRWWFKKRHRHNWSPWRRCTSVMTLAQERNCRDKDCNYTEVRVL